MTGGLFIIVLITLWRLWDDYGRDMGELGVTNIWDGMVMGFLDSIGFHRIAWYLNDHVKWYVLLDILGI